MEHWSVEDYKNFANNKVKKSKYNEQIKLLLMVILLIAKKKLIIIVN